MKVRSLSGLQDVFMDLLPKFMLTCCLSYNEAGLGKGRKKLAQETFIVKFILSRRYFNAAIKSLLAKENR